MAKNVQNSHFSFARIFILVENMSLRSSPLHEAAERYQQFLKTRENLKTYIYIFSLIILTISFSCEKVNIAPKASYNDKANELLKQVMNENSCNCILEIPKESMIKANLEERPGQYKNIRQELIKKLELKNEVELDSLEKLSDDFTLNKNFISEKQIKIIDNKTFSEKDFLDLSKNCPKGIYIVKKPIFDKDYKTAVLDFSLVYSCLDQIEVYKQENGKWIRQ